MNTTDPRKGLPSASSMERLSLCPGSRALAKLAPPQPESEDAASGTRIHAAWAGESVELTGEEQDTLEMLRELEAKAVKAVMVDRAPLRVDRERRLWLCKDYIDNPVMSGQADVIVPAEGSSQLLILDGKTGRNETPIAAENIQLRALAVLAHESYGCETITVGILAPRQSPRCTMARYERHHLDAAREEIFAILEASEAPDAPRNPSLEACRYCPARGAWIGDRPLCPEANAAALALPETTLPATATPQAIAASLTGPTLSEFLRRAKVADKVIEACRDEAKRRLEAGEEVPGWGLKQGRKITEITHVNDLFARAVELGISQAEFLATLKVGTGKLKELVRLHTGTAGRGLEAQMGEILAGCTEEKRASASLEEI